MASELAAGSVTATALAAQSITATALAAQAITASAMAAGSISATALQVGSVAASTLAAQSITATALAAQSITATALAAGSITASALAAQSITATALAAQSITASALAAQSITATALAAGSITASALAAQSITATALAAGSITASALAAQSITATALAAQSITASALAAQSITATALAAGSITASALAAQSITATALAAQIITASALAADSVTASAIATGAVTADSIAAGSITASALGAASVTASAIKAGSITASSGIIADITADAIQSGTLSANFVTIGSGTNALSDAGFNSTQITNARTALSSGGTAGWVIANGTSSGLKKATRTTTTTSDTFSYLVDPHTYANAGQLIPCVAGQVWTLKADTTTSASAAAITFQAYTAKADGTVTTTAITTTSISTTAQRPVSATYTIPAGVTGFMIGLKCNTSGVTWSVHGNAYVGQQVTGDLIVNGAIDGKTITGAQIQTASSGARITLNNAGLNGWDASGNNYLQANPDGIVVTGTVSASGIGWNGISRYGLSAVVGPTAMQNLPGLQTQQGYLPGYGPPDAAPGIGFFPDGETMTTVAGLGSTDGFNAILSAGNNGATGVQVPSIILDGNGITLNGHVGATDISMSSGYVTTTQYFTPLQPAGWTIQGTVYLDTSNTDSRVLMTIKAIRTGGTISMPAGSYTSIGTIVPTNCRSSNGVQAYSPGLLTGGTSPAKTTTFINPSTGQLLVMPDVAQTVANNWALTFTHAWTM
jgi:hypothetical protein